MQFYEFGCNLAKDGPLWDHQVRCIGAVESWLGSSLSNNAQCQLPTGTGKTLIQVASAMMAIRQGMRVLIAVPSQEIVGQFANWFLARTNLQPGISGTRRQYHKGRILSITTQQFLYHREVREQIDSGTLLIWDESHHANDEGGPAFTALAGAFDRALFFSATNWNQSAIRGDLIFRYSLTEAWADKILAPCKFVRISSLADVKEQARGRGIVYHSRRAAIPYGLSVLGGADVSGERSAISDSISKFQAGRIDILHACGRLTEGFDPRLLSWIVGPFTKSSPIGEMQRLGRLLRNDGLSKVCFYNANNEKALFQALEEGK